MPRVLQLLLGKAYRTDHSWHMPIGKKAEDKLCSSTSRGSGQMRSREGAWWPIEWAALHDPSTAGVQREYNYFRCVYNLALKKSKKHHFLFTLFQTAICHEFSIRQRQGGHGEERDRDYLGGKSTEFLFSILSRQRRAGCQWTRICWP